LGMLSRSGNALCNACLLVFLQVDSREGTYDNVVVRRDGSSGGDESFTASFLDGQSLDVGEGDFSLAFRIHDRGQTCLLEHQRNFQMVREAHLPCVLPFAID
jgi:hypothetical protein